MDGVLGVGGFSVGVVGAVELAVAEKEVLIQRSTYSKNKLNLKRKN